MKLITPIVIISILFLGCSPKPFLGRYTSNWEGIDLKNDSTFKYYESGFHFICFSEGKWNRPNSRTLILNSDFPDTTVVFSVDEKRANDNNSIIYPTVNIKYGDELKGYTCALFVNDTLFKQIRCDSLSAIHIHKKIKSFYFTFSKDIGWKSADRIYLDIFTKKYFPKSEFCNLNCSISFNDTLFDYRIFNNEKVKLRNRKIKLFSNYNDKWYPLKKVLNDSKKFPEKKDYD